MNNPPEHEQVPKSGLAAVGKGDVESSDQSTSGTTATRKYAPGGEYVPRAAPTAKPSLVRTVPDLSGEQLRDLIASGVHRGMWRFVLTSLVLWIAFAVLFAVAGAAILDAM